MNKPYEKWIADLKTPDEYEAFARNAADKGRKDLAVLARRHAVDLRSKMHLAETLAEKEALRAVYAYEAALARKSGKRHRANRTWQMIERHGIIAAVERAVNRSQERRVTRPWQRSACRTTRSRRSCFDIRICSVPRL